MCYLCMLRLRCEPYQANQLKMAKILLIVLNVDASRLRSYLALFKAIACLVAIV
jgi:hypothetical protein